MVLTELQLGSLWSVPSTVITIVINFFLLLLFTKLFKFSGYLENKFKKAGYVAVTIGAVSYLMTILLNTLGGNATLSGLYANLIAVLVNSIVFLYLTKHFYNEIWKKTLYLWITLFAVNLIIGIPIRLLIIALKGLFG